MDRYRERHKLSKLTKKSRKTLNRTITCKEMKLASKNLPRKKISGPDGLTGEYY